MPLDSLAMTTQIFWARAWSVHSVTIITEQWTKRFYELAAFSHGLNTYIKGYNEVTLLRGDMRLRQKAGVSYTSFKG